MTLCLLEVQSRQTCHPKFVSFLRACRVFVTQKEWNVLAGLSINVWTLPPLPGKREKKRLPLGNLNLLSPKGGEKSLWNVRPLLLLLKDKDNRIGPKGCVLAKSEEHHSVWKCTAWLIILHLLWPLEMLVGILRICKEQAANKQLLPNSTKHACKPWDEVEE